MNSIWNLLNGNFNTLCVFQIIVDFLLITEILQWWGSSIFKDFDEIKVTYPVNIKSGTSFSLHDLKRSQINISTHKKDFTIEKVIDLSKSCQSIRIWQWGVVVISISLMFITSILFIIKDNTINQTLLNNFHGICFLLFIMIDLALLIKRTSSMIPRIICSAHRGYKKISPYQVSLLLYICRKKNE